MPRIGQVVKPAPVKEKDIPYKGGTSTFRTEQMQVVEGFHAEEIHSLSLVISTEYKIKLAWSKASKTEKEQIQGFIKANSTRKIAAVTNGWSYWFLAYRTNLDTGKRFLTAGYQFQPPGLPLERFRKCLG